MSNAYASDNRDDETRNGRPDRSPMRDGVPAAAGAQPAAHFGDASDPSTKPAIDHERATENEPLPNGPARHSNPLPGHADNRSVMWAGPALRAGSRSESPARHAEPANGVTGTEPAKQARVPGAAVAGDVTQRRTSSAEVVRNVIDVAFVDEWSSANDVCLFGDDVIDAIEKAAIAARFEVVRTAREQIQAVQQARDKRRDTQPAADTVAQYQKKLVLLDKKAWREHAESASPLCAAIASMSGKTQSFYAYKAAAAWREIKAVRRLLTQQDALQRQGNYDEEWLGCVDELRAHCEQLREIQALTLDIARTMAKRTPKAPNSKKNVLRHAQPGWRERFREASAKSKRYAAACVLLDICGMRPKEIENGVTVRHRHGIVGVKIEGAKVRDIAGQPWRVLFVPADKFPTWFLDELGHGHAKVYAAPAAAMRSYLYRLSPKVFPPRPGAKQQLLSAYVLRHAVATDLRQEGWSDEELAAVLGERVAETARHYGLYRRGAKGGRQPEAAIVRDQVKTAIPVRVRDKHWLNQVRPKRNVRGV